jgi:hypothetical protein
MKKKRTSFLKPVCTRRKTKAYPAEYGVLDTYTNNLEEGGFSDREEAKARMKELKAIPPARLSGKVTVRRG